jgi:DNA (cytosine-5)-methyltransferase 1
VSAFYNEIEPYCAAWLRNLIKAGLIEDGEVDERSIVDIRGDDLRGFDRVHFFAGIAGWDLALQLAGWPEGAEVWTGSCPCQPFSSAGKRLGFSDPRDLWPAWRDLIAERQPATIFGEQSAQSPQWLSRLRSDLEALGYAVGAMPIEASSVGAGHARDRFWFVANADSEPLERPTEPWSQRDPWANQPGMDRVAHGVPGRMAKLRALGNAIVPQVAAQFVRAFADG